MFEKGALVICINDENFPKAERPEINFPVKDEIYVVREVIIEVNKKPAIRLEEIINPKLFSILYGKQDFFEPAFYCFRFSLLQEPLDITNLLELREEVLV